MQLPFSMTLVRITAEEDGFEQILDAESLDQWSYTSAYFNGDAIKVEIFMRRDVWTFEEGIHMDSDEMQQFVGGIQFTLKGVRAGRFLSSEPEMEPMSLCHRLDQRKLSYFRKSARMMPIGCTAWMIDDPQHCFLSAGHCKPSDDGVVQFNVPLSRHDGTVRHPHPDDQYAVDPRSIQTKEYYDDGDDWMYLGAFPNSNTKLRPFEAQKDWYRLYTNFTQSPAPESTLVIVGYGISRKQNDGFRNQVQQMHQGPLLSIVEMDNGRKWTLRYQVDTMGGNSGSAIEDEATGLAVGIHTTAGCRVDIRGQPEGSNVGTFVGNRNLQEVLRYPTGVCRHA